MFSLFSLFSLLSSSPRPRTMQRFFSLLFFASLPASLIFSLLIFSLLIVSVGCGGHSGSGGSTTASGNPILCGGSADCTRQTGWTVNTNIDVQPKKKWTFLVYMNGANDLEPFGIENINQMEKIGSTADVNIVVQYERIKGYDTTNGDWTNTRRFYVTRDSDTSTINSLFLSQSTEDTGKVATLKSFVDWGLTTFPAENYAMVVWDHGAGWRAQKLPTGSITRNITRGVSYNDKTDTHIDTIELPDGLTNAKLNNGKWDTVIIDCSLMQMAEVAYEIRNNTRYIVGSEESPPGDGYPYDKFLGPLTQNPAMDALTLSQRVVTETIANYGPNSDTTQSVLDASKVGAIAPALDALGLALTSTNGTYNNQLTNARQTAENYGHGYALYTSYLDILDYVKYLSTPTLTATYVPDATVQSAVSGLKAATQAAIVLNVNGNQHPYSNGLSLFIPSSTQFRAADVEQANGFGQRYQELAIAKDAPNWKQFIQFSMP